MKIGIVWSLLGVLASGSWSAAHTAETPAKSTTSARKTVATATAQPQLALQLGHKFNVADVAYAPNGQLYASVGIHFSGKASEVKIWDGHTGALWRTLPVQANDVTVLAFSKDSRTLITGGTSGTVRVWDAYSGRLLRTLPGLRQPIFALAISPDGRRLAVSSGVEVKPSSETQDLTRSDILIESWAPYGRKILNGVLRIWDTTSWELKNNFTTPGLISVGLAFNPQSRLLGCVTGAEVKLLDCVTGQWKQIAKDDKTAFGSIAFSPDGAWMAVGGREQVQVWSTKFDAEPRVMEGKISGLSNEVAFLPDNKTLVAGVDSGNPENNIFYWDAATGRKLRTLSLNYSSTECIAVSPDGAAIAAGGDGGILHIWDARTGKLRRPFLDAKAWVDHLVFSPDGQKLVSGNEDGTLRWWNLKTGRLERTVNENVGDILNVLFSPDGTHLYSLGQDRKLQGWKVKAGAFHKTLSRTVPHYQSMALSADNSLIATLGGDEKTVRVWNAQTGKLLQYITGHEGFVTGAVFSPDKKTLASAGDEGSVRVFDIAEGICLRELKHQELVTALTYSPDGKYLVSSGVSGNLYIWNAQSGVLVRKCSGNKGVVYSLQFIPNAGLVSVGATGKVQWWNIWTGKVLRTYQFSQSGISACGISRDGRRAAWADGEGIVHLVDLKMGKELLSLAVLPFDSSKDESGDEVSANWISYTPSGYYVASPKASTYIRWRDGLDLKPASAFKSYSRPDIVAGALHGN